MQIKFYSQVFKYFAGLLMLWLSSHAMLASADSIADAFQNGKTNVSFRTRREQVDQDGISEIADAFTVRTRFTFASGLVENWQLNFEFDDVSDWINDYNSTENGKIQYPVIADPEGSDLNLFNLAYRTKTFQATIGRQRINLDNQRFVGGVGWRQNEQTFDALNLGYRVNSDFSLNYMFIHNVNRIFGPTGALSDIHGTHHVLHANYQLNENNKLRFIGLYLDPENAAAIASSTLGLDYSGKYDKLNWHLAYATQSDTGEAPDDYTADYILAEVNYEFVGIKLGAGYELLGSDDGNAAFITPLATLHKFQGFADKFLNTPATGIEDLYFKVSGKISGIGLSVTFHDFAADSGNDNYGDEIDIAAKYALNKNYSFLFKYARYSADDFATDTDKLWLMFTAKY